MLKTYMGVLEQAQCRDIILTLVKAEKESCGIFFYHINVFTLPAYITFSLEEEAKVPLPLCKTALVLET